MLRKISSNATWHRQSREALGIPRRECKKAGRVQWLELWCRSLPRASTPRCRAFRPTASSRWRSSSTRAWRRPEPAPHGRRAPPQRSRRLPAQERRHGSPADTQYLHDVPARCMAGHGAVRRPDRVATVAGPGPSAWASSGRGSRARRLNDRGTRLRQPPPRRRTRHAPIPAPCAFAWSCLFSWPLRHRGSRSAARSDSAAGRPQGC